MRTGLILDNVQTGQGETVPQSSIDKLTAMKATVVGTLWTGGTRHGREVYERCEAVLDKPLYIVRVGGHRQTADEWEADALDVLLEIPEVLIEQERVVLVCGNEPNLEGYKDDPTGYGKLYAHFDFSKWMCPVAFAAPSVGVDGWHTYLVTALANLPANPKHMIANLYDYNTQQAAMLRTLCDHLLIGEVNTLRPNRVGWLRGAFEQLAAAGVEAATIFIAGGRSNGEWPDGYIISQDEAAALGVAPTIPQEEQPMADDPRIQQLLDQNAIITAALIDFRHGRFEGADGIDGKIVALNGGQLPAGWAPSYPPKA